MTDQELKSWMDGPEGKNAIKQIKQDLEAHRVVFGSKTRKCFICDEYHVEIPKT